MQMARVGLSSLSWAAMFFTLTSSAVAAEIQPEAGSGDLARADGSGCASRVCHNREAAADGEATSTRVHSVEEASSVVVRLGIGGGAFHGPTPDLVIPLEGIAQDGSPIDYSAPQRARIAGAAVSLGVSLEQPLTSTSALGLGVEERFTLLALVTGAGDTSVGGFLDPLLVVREAGFPLRVELGPSLAVARLDLHDATLAQPAVIVGGAGVVRLDLGRLLPGALELAGHLGKPLSYDGGSYRDLQLMFALPL